MIENNFDIAFTARLAIREKQIQQSYRPIIGVHKWFARRPGSVFRSLLLAEFDSQPVAHGYWQGHRMRGVIADPFMGGGTPVFEAVRLGFSVVGADVNPMAYWIVRQSLSTLDLDTFGNVANDVIGDVESAIESFYKTTCSECGESADVKYFIWVKVRECPECGADNDLFPGYRLSKADRHPAHVIACKECGDLNEFDHPLSDDILGACRTCGETVSLDGPASRGRVRCHDCGAQFKYLDKPMPRPLRHRMWAIEYHCASCKPTWKGRFFKKPDESDLGHFRDAAALFQELRDELPIPNDSIPSGDESDRLHRWGYRSYHEMFNERQLLGLGILLRRIKDVREDRYRHALLTVFSDFLRYQNMLCRYDTYALKCQDIFSVHGFPVGLIQCENNLLGINMVGSGAFRHFIEKYKRAKQYADRPTEQYYAGGRRKIVRTGGEHIRATFVDSLPTGKEDPEAHIMAVSAEKMPLEPDSLDGIFTDPPYYDNVQYAELMDFCFAWLRLGLKDQVDAFQLTTTRTGAELTGNETMGRGPAHFTEGLSEIFCHFASALKPGAPLVFTYHHNDPAAYLPLVVGILDAGLDCTTTIPVPAEMGASLHISGTDSSVIDSVFVCRAVSAPTAGQNAEETLISDMAKLRRAGLSVSVGDIRCHAASVVARTAINKLRPTWDANKTLSERMALASDLLKCLAAYIQVERVVQHVEFATSREHEHWIQVEAAL